MKLFLLLSFLAVGARGNDDYWSQRQEIINVEMEEQLGGSLHLSDEEEIANKMLMSYKLEELDRAFEDPAEYLPGKHFFETKENITFNKVFGILRDLPKGGLLHNHDSATTSWDYLYQQTWLPNLYLCNDTNQFRRLKFFEVPDNTCDWKLLSELRAKKGNEFENWFKSLLTLVTKDYNEKYTDINKVWKTFENIFILVSDLVLFRPVFEDQYYTTLQELYNDNITYVEMRSTLSSIYDLDGTKYDAEQVLDIYYNITEKFKLGNPEFIGAKIIFAPSRQVDEETVINYIETAKRINSKYPGFLAGFDLVGQEDLGRPLSDFVHLLNEFNFNYFFHAGETNWNHGLTDQNMVDAILLGTKRLGHAFALSKHPELIRLVKEKRIAVEVSPISNQVLHLVQDLRNHPAAIYMANNVPMVITNDDPTFWDAQGVSYDWYMAFMGIASRNADLKLLKQLAINSLEFSAMNDEEKVLAFAKWEKQWNSFIKRFVAQNTL